MQMIATLKASGALICSCSSSSAETMLQNARQAFPTLTDADFEIFEGTDEDVQAAAAIAEQGA